MMPHSLPAGVDEVGRGPLAGPVVCAAVILSPEDPCYSLYRDSKKLSEKKRLRFYRHLRHHAVAYALTAVSPAEIDRLNILQATLLGMQQAVCALPHIPAYALIDGNRLPENLPCPASSIIGGDNSEPCIAAASIMAKVVRDRLMALADVRYPGYGFARHKGYGTREHIAALQAQGASPYHRFSFAPVKQAAR